MTGGVRLRYSRRQLVSGSGCADCGCAHVSLPVVESAHAGIVLLITKYVELCREKERVGREYEAVGWIVESEKALFQLPSQS